MISDASIIDYLHNIERCTVDSWKHVCTWYLVVVKRAWAVGRDKHFTQYIERIPAETHNGYVMNYLRIPAKMPTQVATQDLLYA